MLIVRKKINKIKKIEDNLSNKEMNINEFFAQKEIITLSKERNIDIFDNFIIVDKYILHLFIKNNLISKNNKDIKSVKHICGNNKNIILIDNQKYILFGSIINNENIFKLEYIFDYYNNNFRKAITELINNNINYFKQKLFFNSNFQNDYSSPIYEYDDEIGICYKYKNSIKDFSDYDINPEIIRIIFLSF